VKISQKVSGGGLLFLTNTLDQVVAML